MFQDLTAIIESGAKFEGKLFFTGQARIAGEFKGEIFTHDTLVIGEGAKVSATVDADIVIIAGDFEGRVQARTRVEMNPPARFRGVVVTPIIQISEGVVFEGETKTMKV